MNLTYLQNYAEGTYNEQKVQFRAVGEKMYGELKELFPICRSLSGEGNRQTLNILKSKLPSLKILSFPSGHKAFDWSVPKEWNINDAFLTLENSNERLIDFQKSNLHAVSYSTPINALLSWEELLPHLHTLEHQPTAIPYVASYYKENWGLCLSYQRFLELKTIAEKNPHQKFHAVIDSSLENGVVNYGELIIPGESDEEVLLSTYICHPSMASNELSGPIVASNLAEWILTLPKRCYTYRILFLVETIGALAYLSLHHQHMKEKTVAGFVLTCLGDDKKFSYLFSKDENTLTDRVSLHAFKSLGVNVETYSFLERGSDERQYSSPGIDLPVGSIMRSKYGTFPEYHTSLDNLDFASPEGLLGGYLAYKEAITILEHNFIYRSKILGEPQLGKRGLYPSSNTKTINLNAREILNFLAYIDGKSDLITIAEKIQVPVTKLLQHVKLLEDGQLIEKVFS